MVLISALSFWQGIINVFRASNYFKVVFMHRISRFLLVSLNFEFGLAVYMRCWEREGSYKNYKHCLMPGLCVSAWKCVKIITIS